MYLSCGTSVVAVTMTSLITSRTEVLGSLAEKECSSSKYGLNQPGLVSQRVQNLCKLVMEPLAFPLIKIMLG